MGLASFPYSSSSFTHPGTVTYLLGPLRQDFPGGLGCLCLPVLGLQVYAIIPSVQEHFCAGCTSCPVVATESSLHVSVPEPA